MFGGAKGFCPSFPKFIRNKISGHFSFEYFLIKAGFSDDLQKQRSSCDFGLHFFKSKHIGGHLFKACWAPFF